ncbi:MAG: PilW family protein [Burkholderiaceae bacterium]
MTLVELMVGAALGLLVVLAVVYVFAGSRASYRHQESFSAVQESGRIALELLTRDIRMAGFPGCGNLLYMDHRSSGDALPANARFGNEVAIAGDPTQVTVVRGSAESANLVASPASNQIQLDNIALLGTVTAGDRLLVSDCVFTEVLTVAAVAGNAVTAAGALSRQYRPGSRVMRLEQVAFTRSAQGELLRNGQAIAAGLDALSFQFGIPGPGSRSVTNYLDAPTALQMQSVVAVRLNMTVTDREVSQMPFSTTVTLRNRAP